MFVMIARSISKPVACHMATFFASFQVERLQRKFAMIHSTLAQQQAAKGDPDTPKLRQSADVTAAMQQGPAVNVSQATLVAPSVNVSFNNKIFLSG